MASVILTNWTVYYKSDTGGDKQIRWTGGGGPETNTNTVNELYSAIADLFSIPTQNEAHDTIPMQAVTPTVYNIGAIDQKDQDAWFIDPISIQHLTGGSIQTVNWTRVVNADANVGTPGIVKMAYTAGGTAPSLSDIGLTITMTTDTDTGEILYVDVPNLQMWIRPASCLAANSFDNSPTPNGAFTISGSAATGNQNGASVTGERLWSNAFTLGTIETNTQMFVYQNFVKITNFWSAGHMNRLFLINDGFASGLIDSGLLTVYAREYSKFYDHFMTDTSGGGNNPVPIATIADTNNTSGYYQTVFTDSAGTWAVGQTFTKNGDSAREGTVTSVTGSNPNVTIQYYLSGISLTAFSNADAVTSSGSATGTIVTPTNVGPAILTGITITFGATNKDIGDGGGSKPYDVLINVGGNTLANFYEYTKYITRRGNTTDIDSGGQTVIGERYFSAGSVRLSYDNQTVNFLQGATLTGQTSGAKGVITADHDSGTIGTLIVRDVRGDFLDNENIRDNQGTPGNADIIATGGIVFTTIVKGSPFGTLAGVNFFGARGVWIENMHANDANRYELIDSNGVKRTPPTTYPISITVNDTSNTAIQNAQVFVHKAGTYYNYTSHNTNNVAGDATFDVNEVVDTDLPQTGWLHVHDASTNTQQNYRYASWAVKTFTFPTEVTGSATSAGDSTTLNSTGIGALNIQEGDTIRNTTDGSWAVVDELSTNSATTSALLGGSDNTWQNSDSFSVHRLAVTYVNTDIVDIPILNGQTNGSGLITATYAGTVPISIEVRIRSNQGTPKYVPFNTSGSITSNGYPLTAALTTDTVAS